MANGWFPVEDEWAEEAAAGSAEEQPAKEYSAETHPDEWRENG